MTGQNLLKIGKLILKESMPSYHAVLYKNNVDVIHGCARFADNNTIEVNGEILTANHILIATGTKAYRPDIEGAEFGIDSN